MEAVMARELTYQERIEALRATKLAQTQEKQQVIGAMDYDDWALILPPPERRILIDTISPSGVPIKDVLTEDNTRGINAKAPSDGSLSGE